MAIGRGCKGMMSPILLVNLVMYIIILGLAGWSIDKYIDGETHHHLGGNPSTVYLLMFSLLAGAVGVCSVIAGFLHLRTWGSDSLASALSSALVSWALDILAFGLACKQIRLGNRGRRLRTLEAFIIILTFTQIIYLIMLHAGIISSKYGPGFRNYGTDYGEMMETHKDTSSNTAPPDA